VADCGPAGFVYLGKHPRKELLEHFGRKHADRVYVDRKDGTYHVGYVIAGLWIRVLGVEGVTFAKKVD
jgi:hypothetical protein